MSITLSTLNNEQFVKQFENQTLDPIHFKHEGHIRIACIYLNTYEFAEANSKACNGIKSYAESLGAKNKFNLTVTDAVVKLMAGRMRGRDNNYWETFIENNQDIVQDTIGVLGQYYSKNILFSKDATVSVIAPDLKAFDM